METETMTVRGGGGGGMPQGSLQHELTAAVNTFTSNPGHFHIHLGRGPLRHDSAGITQNQLTFPETNGSLT